MVLDEEPDVRIIEELAPVIRWLNICVWTRRVADKVCARALLATKAHEICNAVERRWVSYTVNAAW